MLLYANSVTVNQIKTTFKTFITMMRLVLFIFFNYFMSNNM